MRRFIVAVLCFIPASVAVAADRCTDLTTWGPAGQFLTGTLAVMAALRPVSQLLLVVGSALGPHAALAARVIYGLGQFSGMLCISKPAFAQKYQKPDATKVEAPKG